MCQRSGKNTKGRSNLPPLATRALAGKKDRPYLKLPATRYRLPATNLRLAATRLILRRSLRIHDGRRASRAVATTTAGAATRSTTGSAFTDRLAADAESILYWASRAVDALRQIRRERAVLSTLRAERLTDGVIALVALVRQQVASVERCQRQRQRERLA